MVDNAISYFGETVIERIERLHVTGTSDTDLIYGGILGDYIDGGNGDDFVSGGIDIVADELLGGSGDDTFFWVNSGDDTVDGGAGTDTINISYNVSDDFLDNSVFGNTYQFFDASGERLDSPGANGEFTASSADHLLVDALNFSRVAATQRVGFNYKVTFESVERINIIGSRSADDLLIYQGGNYYDGGEDFTGLDGDVFIADFSGQAAGIDFRINDVVDEGEEDGYWLANDVFIKGIDRGVIQAGDGLDILIGGRFGDIFMGGGGNDVLYGGDDNSPDILEGGEGSDSFFWYTDPFDPNKAGGSDVVNGGTNADGSYENDHLIMGGGNGPSRVAIETFDASQNEFIDILPNNGGSTRGYAWAYSDRSVIQQLAENSLTPDIRWSYYNSSVGQLFDEQTGQTVVGWDPTKQRDGRALTYEQVETVDIAGSDEYDEIIVYQHGVAYVGGESEGDADLFVADLREFSDNLFIDVNTQPAEGSEPGVGYDIGQGTSITEFERFHLLLGDGDDTVKGGDLDDTAYAGGGNDELSGGLGNDQFYGEEGNDFFEHLGGRDEFYGGSGNDVLLVGGTDEPFELSFFDASDELIGSRFSMVGATPSFADFSALYGITTDEYIVIEHGPNSLRFEGMEEVHMSGSEQNDVLIGGTVQGVLFGGDGDDALIGLSGNDFMSGGAGSDLYVFGADFGNDVIFGEDSGVSKLIFTANAEEDLSFSLDGIDLIISVGANSVRVLDYFASDDAMGLNFEFETTDGSFTRDFTSLGAVSTGAPLRGVTFLGSNEDEDIVDGTSDVDTIRAFGGDDFILSSSGGDIIDGGSGADAVSYLGSDAAVTVNLLTFTGKGGYAEGDLLVSIEHIAGSTFDDAITGNNFGNVISGGDGADTLDGLDGDGGNDSVEGGAGTDFLSGGAGNDELDGGNDADVFDDGQGDDTAIGGDGNDVFLYTGGLDDWDGSLGSDSADFDRFDAAIEVNLTAINEVVTRDGPDLAPASGALRSLTQLSNIENVRGTIHHDRLQGDAGANQLEGNLGDDRLTGNEGADILIGGAGIDTLDYSLETGSSGVSVWMDSPGEEYGEDTHGDTDILSGIENVIGTDQADHVTGNAADNIIWGGAGDDYYLDGLQGNDTIYGDEGNDLILGGDDDDTLIGGAGDDDVEGEAGDDLFIGHIGPGSDTYDGGADFDTVSYAGTSAGIVVDLMRESEQVSGADIDSDTLISVENIIGGSGDDTMIGNEEDNSFSYFGGFDTYDGGDGFDTVSFSQFDSAVLVDLSGAGEARTRDRFDLRAGDARTIARIVGVESIIGSHYDDTLIGNEFDNILWGGEGNDILDGGMQNDAHMGGEGDDVFANTQANGSDLFDGGDGIDTLDYSANDTSVVASLIDGDGDDVLISVERLVGTNFGDSLAGNEADNIIQGGSGDDLIQAGRGDDLVIYMEGFDEVYGGVGTDTLDYTFFGAAIDLDFNNVAAVFTGDSADWNVGPTRQITEVFDRDVENAIGSAFNDRLVGNQADNMFNGGFGDDLILGMGGDDMFAYSGGLDTWDGGEGADTANFSTYQYAVQVDLRATGAQALTRMLTTVTTGDWLEIARISNVENIIGSLFDDGLFGDDQSNIILGWGGNDLLSGGEGDDEIDGGAGADTAVFSGSSTDYEVSKVDGVLTVRDTNPADGDEGTDTLYEIETLRFADGDQAADPSDVPDGDRPPGNVGGGITLVDPDDDGVLLDSSILLNDGTEFSAAEAQLFRVYSGALGRTPDDEGFDWWLDQIEQGNHTLQSLSAGFIDSVEFRGSADTDNNGLIENDEFIEQMYLGVFGGPPDQSGFDFWTAELESGARTQADVLVAMTQSNDYVEQTVLAVVDYLIA